MRSKPHILGSPSYLGGAGRFIADRVRAHLPHGDRPPDAGGTQGVSVEISDVRIDEADLRRYLDLTGGWFEGAGAERKEASLPPVYSGVWELACVLDLLRLARLPFPVRGILVASSERVRLRDVPVSDGVRLRMVIDAVEPRRSGLAVMLAGSLWNRSGRLCSETRIELRLGTGQRSGAGGPGTLPRSDSAPQPVSGWQTIERIDLDGSAGRRFARVSGDFNPVHLHTLTARWFGLRAPVAHGGMIEAVVAHSIIRHRLAGDPSALRRLSIRYLAPTFLPASVVIETGDRGEGGHFRLVDSGRGSALAVGEWTGTG